jgi:hypothetical protein
MTPKTCQKSLSLTTFGIQACSLTGIFDCANPNNKFEQDKKASVKFNFINVDEIESSPSFFKVTSFLG